MCTHFRLVKMAIQWSFRSSLVLLELGRVLRRPLAGSPASTCVAPQKQSYNGELMTAFSTSSVQNVQFCKTAQEALVDVKNGATIMAGGFGMCGIPEHLIQGLVDKDLKNLQIISTDFGVDDFGLGLLLKKKQVKKVIASYIGENKTLCNMYMKGELDVELVPSGTIAERVRAGGAGVPAFFTQTGYGTMVQKGNIPIRYKPDGSIIQKSTPREVRQFHGINYILEKALTGDVAIIHAWKADKAGNLQFNKTARNFNPTMARACTLTIAEVEEIVEIGQIPPEDVQVPHIYVSRIFKGDKFQKRIAKLRFHDNQPELSLSKGKEAVLRERIARRVALEFHDGMYVNLGIGMPELSSNFVPQGITVHLMGENGILGLGPFPKKGEEDPDLINSGKETVTIRPGGCYVSSDEAFSMVRGNHIGVNVMGGMQVSRFGDLANWMIPSKLIMGMGGAMDLAAADKPLIIAMKHCDKDGKPKILNELDLPLTGHEVVDRIITERAVFDVHKKEGLTLLELAEGETVETIKKSTGCDFKVSPDLQPMQQSSAKGVADQKGKPRSKNPTPPTTTRHKGKGGPSVAK